MRFPVDKIIEKANMLEKLELWDMSEREESRGLQGLGPEQLEELSCLRWEAVGIRHLEKGHFVSQMDIWHLNGYKQEAIGHMLLDLGREVWAEDKNLEKSSSGWYSKPCDWDTANRVFVLALLNIKRSRTRVICELTCFFWGEGRFGLFLAMPVQCECSWARDGTLPQQQSEPLQWQHRIFNLLYRQENS